MYNQRGIVVETGMKNVSKLFTILNLAILLTGLHGAAFAAEQGSTFMTQHQTLMHDGLKRTFEIRVPKRAEKGSVPMPLVLVLHGGGGTALNAENMTGFTEKAIRKGFIVVYPEGTGKLNLFPTWNAVHCCGYAMEKKVDDVGFINALLDKLIDEYPIDRKRVFVTGMSNGGMMAHRLGIQLSNRFAAIAPVVATLFGDEKKSEHPVAALMVNGMLDKSVPYQGGLPGGRFPDSWDGTPAKSAMEQATFWAKANGCESNPVKFDRDKFVFWKYHCPAGKDVEIYLVKDNGHAWPGGKQGSRRGDKPSLSLDATDIILSFFESHGK